MEFCQSLEPVDDARRLKKVFFPGKALERVSIHSQDKCGLKWVATLMPTQTERSLMNLFDSFEFYLCPELLR